MLFVVLVASSVGKSPIPRRLNPQLTWQTGVFGPILMSTFVQVKTNLFLTILKQFGTGVIISTAFVHVRALFSW